MARRNGKDRGVVFKQGGWWVRLYVNGREKWFRADSKSQAKTLYGRLRSEARENRYFPEKYAVSKELTLRAWIARYLEGVTSPGLRNVHRYGKFWSKLLGRKLLTEITAEDLRHIQAKMKHKGTRTARTINRYFGALRRILNLAIADGLLSANPIKGVKFFSEPAGRLRFLNDKEISSLRDTLPPEHWLIVAFALETGLRLTEQFHSRWDCLNTEQGILTIPLSKSGKTRHVILTDAALEIVKGLSSWMHSPFLFPSPLTSAQPMQGRNFVVKIYEPGLKRAKIEGVTWHTLRHTFASRAVMAGVDIRTVQELMGHSTITMTMRYAHLSPAHLRTAVNRASLGAIAAKSASGTGSKTGSSDNQRVEQGPVRITEPSEISIGMGGGAGRVRTAASQFCSLPELSEVPLTYTSGQPVAKAATSHVAKDALELRPMRIVAAHLPSTPTRNIFEAAETPTSDKRLVRAAVNKKEVPSPIPVVAMPVVPPAPPMPSPEEVAEQAARLARERARQQLREVMAQYRYLGYLTGQGEQQAFLGKGQEIYIIHLGDTLDGQFQVASITPTTVKILAAHADVETTIQLKTDSSVEPS